MPRPFKWFIAGGFATAVAITGGVLWVESDRRHTEALTRENQRLAKEHEALAQKNRELALETQRLEEERRILETVVDRLGVEKRVAVIDVVEQHTDETGAIVQTVIRMTEMGRDDKPLAPRTFGVAGRVPHFDAWVIKFDDAYVGSGDALRGHSLALFRRVYGESQTPQGGYWLGTPGEAPDIYRTGAAITDFEKRLWTEFWSYATDPAKARSAGVRVAQGEAVYAPMTTGDRWLLSLEADGGLNLVKQVD